MPERKLGVAVIGAGMVSATHLHAIADLSDHLDLRGIWSRNPERAAKAGCRVYGSVDEVCADETVDFAIILTPPNGRVDIVTALARAGKHILMEKPVGRSSAEARKLTKICRDAGVTMGVVFQHRMREASLAAAQLVATGTLGALGLAEIDVPWWRDQGYYDEPGRGTRARDGGGVLISQAIHTIDLALSLTGPVHSVQAMAATTRFHRMETEDFVSAGLRFVNGAVGSLRASTASYPGGAESITLHFENGSIRLCAGILRIDWRDGRTEEIGAAGGTGGGADPMAFTHAWHQGVIADFADALRNNREPVVTGEIALQSHMLIDAIIASADLGAVVEIDE